MTKTFGQPPKEGETQGRADVLSFGPFRLMPRRRLLERNGVPVSVGARALDILIALASRPNDVIGKRELLASVWPDVTVEEGSLRFHIANLRKALGDGRDGGRYIATLPGRGYSFVALVARSYEGGGPAAAGSDAGSRSILPPRLLRMVGRSAVIEEVAGQLESSRFVTIVGPGGIGKTTVAVAVAHEVVDALSAAAIFVDLGGVSDPVLVPAALSSLLGLSVRSDDSLPALLAYLRDRRALLVFDTCEHLIDSVAALATQIFAAAPQVHILATSREALRVEGEQVYRLPPLACPPDDPHLTAAAAAGFPAFELFLERARARGARLHPGDQDAGLVAAICRRLDGVALAIELAAGGVEAHGLQQTAALLDRHLTLPWLGQRTAPPRQRTVQATLDWSYGLLSDLERRVLRRLAVFVGSFTFEAALEVAVSSADERDLVFAAIDSLVAKSMVAARPVGAMMRYRLLDVTRAYVLGLGADPGEPAASATRHARYYLGWLGQGVADSPGPPDAAERAAFLGALGNVRAALDWCFGTDGDPALGVQLAAVAAPAFLAVSLLTECRRWSACALAAVGGAVAGEREEMNLQAALGIALIFTRGGEDAARVALHRSLALAERCGDGLGQLQALGPLQMFNLRTGDFRAAKRCAEQGTLIADTLADASAVAVVRSLLGLALHLSGDLEAARLKLDAALRNWPGPGRGRGRAIHLGFEGRILARAVLSRNRLLQGCPGEAQQIARSTVEDAAAMNHPLTLAVALISAIQVSLWSGDHSRADDQVDALVACAKSHSLGPYVAIGLGFRGELENLRGQPGPGSALLSACIGELRAAPYELLTTPFHIPLVQALARIGQLAEARRLLDETIGLSEAKGDLCYLPELLRVKGVLLLQRPDARTDLAEACFGESLVLSRRQGARFWELRTAMELAALLAARGEAERAEATLRPVVTSFPEKEATADLRAAGRFLATVGS